MDGPDTKWRNGPRTALAHARLSGVTVRDGTIETCASPNGRGQQPFTPERCPLAPGREFPALPHDRASRPTSGTGEGCSDGTRCWRVPCRLEERRIRAEEV